MVKDLTVLLHKPLVLPVWVTVLIRLLFHSVQPSARVCLCLRPLSLSLLSVCHTRSVTLSRGCVQAGTHLCVTFFRRAKRLHHRNYITRFVDKLSLAQHNWQNMGHAFLGWVHSTRYILRWIIVLTNIIIITRSFIESCSCTERDRRKWVWWKGGSRLSSW